MMSICIECGGNKIIYKKFCSNSCAGKYKYRTSQKVRDAIKMGQQIKPQSKYDAIRNYWRGKQKPFMRNEKNWNWNGGNRREGRHILMGRVEYKNWRLAVFVRDKFTCQLCGKHGGNLNADHIKPYALYPELVLDINNGRTLCIECHRQTESWGRPKKCQHQVIMAAARK